MALNQFFFAMGVQRTSVAHVALIVGTTPIFVYGLSALVGQERFRPAKLIGMGICILGIAVLQKSDTGKASLEGDAIAFLGVVAFTIFTVFSKTLSGRLSISGTMTLNYLGASIILAPGTLALAMDFPFHQLLPVSWACLFFMAAVPSVLCFYLYFRVLRGLTASKLSVFAYMQPVMASAMAIPLLGEQMTGGLIGGGLLVLLGVFLTEKF
jgi:drug/metabolite transporter (DMT)-like permease